MLLSSVHTILEVIPRSLEGRIFLTPMAYMRSPYSNAQQQAKSLAIKIFLFNILTTKNKSMQIQILHKERQAVNTYS